MTVIIVGASGFVGRNLRQFFLNAGEQVIGTYHSTPAAGLLPFDLGSPNLDALGAEARAARAAIICSSVTDMDRCREDWLGTHRINVEGATSLIAQLQGQGTLPVFISTDYVYGGTRGNYKEDDERVPVLAYGKQKKEVEDFLLESGKPFVIARMGRVYSLSESDDTILTRVSHALRRGETLRMAVDQIFSPSGVTDICRALRAVVERSQTGPFNLGPPSGISRFDFAAAIRDHLGITTGSILPCPLEELQFGDSRPLDTSLDTSHMTAVLGLRFATIHEALETPGSPALPWPA